MSGIFPDSGVPPTDANNSLPNPPTVNCPDELWYSTSRCTPRFDPAAANAIMSEILNFVACGGTVYDCSKLDNMCTATKDLILDQLFSCLPDRFVNINATCSNEFVILQRDATNNCVRLARTDDMCKIINDLINAALFGCLTQNFPSAASACSIEQLVMTTDSTGCRKIARYSEAAATLGTAVDNSVWGTNYPATNHPINPADPSTFYEYGELAADIAANAVKAKINNTHAVSLNINVPCANTWVTVTMGNSVNFQPAQNNANGCVSRFVLKYDNVWKLNAQGNISQSLSTFTNFQSSHSSSVDYLFTTAGNHKVDAYFVQWGSRPPAQVTFIGSAVAAANSLSVKLRA